MQKYQIDFKIGGGGYGKVYHCHNKVTGQTYAMKKIRLEAEEGGISASTLREISILKGVQRAKHENIIE
jgi:serine/threonine protein kinase